MPWDAGNINILHARSVRKTRTETTQQIAVPHGLPWISGNFYFLYMGGGSLTHHLSHNFVTLQFHKPLCHTPSFTHHLWHTLFHTPSFTPLCHTPSFTHHLSHTTLSPTIFDTPSLTHHLSHTALSHTIFHTPLCHTPSFKHHLSHTIFHHTIFHTHNFVTHHLSPHIFHTPLFHRQSFTHNFVTRSVSHTTFTHTIFQTQVCHTHTPSFFVTHHLSHTTLSHTTLFYFSILHHLLCLSFLPSPSPLQHLVLIIGRSCLVGLSGPLIFEVLTILTPLFCFSACRRLRLVLVLWCWSLLLVFLFWCPVASARPVVSLFWWLCLVFFVWCSGLPGASARPGMFVFFPVWLWFVFGVCLLALWGFCLLARGCFLFLVLVVLHHLFCFSSCWRLRLIFVLWCWSPLLSFLFWCPVASARPGVSFFWWLCLVFFVLCSGLPGASARPGLSPCVVVIGDWR